MKTAMIKACQDMKLSSHTTNALLAGLLGTGYGAVKTKKEYGDSAQKEDYAKNMALYGAGGLVAGGLGSLAYDYIRPSVKGLTPQKASVKFNNEPVVAPVITEDLQDILKKHEQQVLGPKVKVETVTPIKKYNYVDVSDITDPGLKDHGNFINETIDWRKDLDEEQKSLPNTGSKVMKDLKSYITHNYGADAPHDLYPDAKKIFSVLKPEHNLTADQISKLESYLIVAQHSPESKGRILNHLKKHNIPEDVLQSLGFE